MDSQQKQQNLLKEVKKLCENLKKNNIKQRDSFFNSEGDREYRESTQNWEVYEDDPRTTFGGVICYHANKEAFLHLKKTGALDIGVCWKCGDSPIANEYEFNSDHISYFICENCYHGGRSFQKKYLGYAKGNDSSSSKCYIATVCYGDINAIQVQEFRKFRDKILSTSFFGRLFIKFYYFVSPSIASLLKSTPRLNSLIRLYILDTILKHIENSAQKKASR